ncbi:hypothetical protein NQ024_06485 [Corynebacterium sp. 35RC1]|nr:hypothetical protein [Corynebacterium sp. 35RC1]
MSDLIVVLAESLVSVGGLGYPLPLCLMESISINENQLKTEGRGLGNEVPGENR